MHEGAAVHSTEQPRDFVTSGLIVLFWGIGLGTFLSLTHTWFDGVRFYAVSPSIVAIAVIAVGVLSFIAAISAPTPVTLRSRRKQVLFGIALLLWIMLGASYRFTSDFGRLSAQHELARAYRADPVCGSDLLTETAKRGPSATVAPGATPSSVCRVGWSTVTGKTTYGNCLLLNGAAANGAFCFGNRSHPACDWADVKVGEAIVAQTAYGRPASYFCPTRDPSLLLLFRRGEIIQAIGNPAREFQLMFDNRILWVGAYLLVGFVIVYRNLS